MPTLRPGPVFTAWNSFGGAPVIVGGGSQWGDDSDATYAVSDAPSGSLATSPAATFDLAGISGILEATLRYRVSMTTTKPPAYDRRAAIELNVPGGGSASRQRFTQTLVDTDAIQEGALVILPRDGYDSGFFTPYLSDALTVNFFAVNSEGLDEWSSALTVYEVWFDYTPTGTFTAIAPPTRFFPANHPALGTQRIWPRENSRQAGRLNGYQ